MASVVELSMSKGVAYVRWPWSDPVLWWSNGPASPPGEEIDGSSGERDSPGESPRGGRHKSLTPSLPAPQSSLWKLFSEVLDGVHGAASRRESRQFVFGLLDRIHIILEGIHIFLHLHQ